MSRAQRRFWSWMTRRSWDEISPPPQALRGIAVGYVWRSKEVPAGYHIARNWPSGCGTGLVFMQDMVGRKPPLPSPRPGSGQDSDPRHSGAMQSIEPGISRFRVRFAPRDDGYGYANRYGPPFSMLRWNAGRA